MAARQAVTELNISINSRPEYLPRLRTIVGCLAGYVGMSSQQIQDTKLVFTEACANAIRHGSPDGQDGGVVVKLAANARAMILEVTDHGCGFNVDEIVVPVPGSRPGGLGIPLMRALSDRVEFHRGRKGMTVRLVKKIESNVERRKTGC